MTTKTEVRVKPSRASLGFFSENASSLLRTVRVNSAACGRRSGHRGRDGVMRVMREVTVPLAAKREREPNVDHQALQQQMHFHQCTSVRLVTAKDGE